MRKQVAVLMIVLALTALACAGLSLNLPNAGDLVGTALATNGLGDLVELATMLATTGLSDDAQSMVETMVAGGTVVPMETLMAGFSEFSESGTILFQDDFSDTSSGWDRAEFENGATDYQDGGYHIFVGPENYSVFAKPGLSFTDVSVEVDGYKLSGVDDGEYGVICRYVDANNFYAASVTSDGYYGIIRFNNGSFEYVGMDSMQLSDAVNRGEANNRIRFDCVGSTLTLYVNGAEVVSVSDSLHASGDVGLYGGTFDSPNVDVMFDNFVVRQP